MRMLDRSRVVALALALLAAGPAAAEDLTVVMKDGKGATQTQYYTSTLVRHALGDHDSIIDLAAGTITMVDHQKKEYSVVTLDQIEAALAQTSAQMEQAMANVTPEMRQKMEEMMGGAIGAIAVTKGGTRKVSGYDTQQYTITMGENLTTDLWTTTALQFPFDPAQFRKMASFSNTFAANPMMRSAAKMAERMKEIPGFTLAESTSIKMMGRTTETSREAVEVKKGPIAAAAFAIPGGYTKVESPLLKRGGGSRPR
jgi:hypothetical protein